METAHVNKCPICQKSAQEKHQPFCSTRCANIDLGRWFGESYRVPTEENETSQQRESESGS